MVSFFKRALSLITLLCLPTLVLAQGWNMPEGVTPISHEIFHLHMIIFYVCVAIALVVFGAMFYMMLRFRRTQGAQAEQFHHNTLAEVIWTVIPALILIVMAVPATRVLMAMHNTDSSTLSVKIVGHQWHWEYSYLDQGIHYFSHLKTPQNQIHGKAKKGPHYLLEVDKALVLPIHRKIRFLVTSSDVNHSWWVPQLGVKKDAIPGIINTAWARIDKPGIYRGQCTELCGMQHGFMPIVVVALTEKDFATWVKHHSKGHRKVMMASAATDQPSADNHSPSLMALDEEEAPIEPLKNKSKAQLMSQGKMVYTQRCAVCHKADGSGMPPAFPAMKGSKVSVGPVGPHIHIILYGKKGSAMQAFKDQLSMEDIASVVTYERNTWGNDDKTRHGKHAGGLVQPQDVQNYHDKHKDQA